MKFNVKKNDIEKIADNFPNVIRYALIQSGEVATGYAKVECPVDTGRLRGSITYSDEERSVYIGTNVEYAPYVELGTSKMTARPYLKPALADHKDAYARIFGNAINEALR